MVFERGPVQRQNAAYLYKALKAADLSETSATSALKG